MLSQLPAYKILSEDSRIRVDAFWQRFCEGALGMQYGLGHIVYAAHAAFPLMLSPELANLIWLNFRNYRYVDEDDPVQVNQVAVADFLMSPLCKQINSQHFEVIPDIRSFLLSLLSNKVFFRSYGIVNEGDARITELANFLEQYLARKTSTHKYDGTGFKELNKWAIDAWLRPQALANELFDSFHGYVLNKNEKGQLWLTLQMEKVKQQYDNSLSAAKSEDQFAAFNRLYFYSKARKEQLYKKSAEAVYDYSKEIVNFVDDGLSAKAEEYKFPLLKEAAERTERRIKKVQRVFCLAVGIDKYTNAPKTRFSGSDAHTIVNMLQGLEKGGVIQLHSKLLIDKPATKSRVLDELAALYQQANEEDIVLFFFAGHSYLDTALPTAQQQSDPHETTYYRLLMADYKDTGLGKTISHLEFREFVSAINRKNAQTVVILESEVGYFDWTGPNGILIGSNRYGEAYESLQLGNSLFTWHLVNIIGKTGGKITYRDLITYLRFQLRDEPGAQVPIIYAREEFYNRCFLTKLDASPADYSLTAANKSKVWEMLPQNFRIERASEFAYATNKLIADAGVIEGAVRFDRNFRRSVFQKDSRLSMNLPYYTVEKRDEKIYVKRASYTALELAITQLLHYPFPLWHQISIEPAISGFAGFDADSSSLAYWQMPDTRGWIQVMPGAKANQYTLQIAYANDSQLKILAPVPQIVQEVTIPEMIQVLTNFANFYYLSELEYPTATEYREYLISVSFVATIDGNEIIISPDTLPASLYQLIYIKENNILFHPIEVMIHNDEEFPLFARSCFLGNDFSVYLDSGEIQIPSRLARRQKIDITEVATKMLEKKSAFQFKLLTSRDPIRIGLSQMKFYPTASR